MLRDRSSDAQRSELRLSELGAALFTFGSSDSHSYRLRSSQLRAAPLAAPSSHAHCSKPGSLKLRAPILTAPSSDPHSSEIRSSQLRAPILTAWSSTHTSFSLILYGLQRRSPWLRLWIRVADIDAPHDGGEQQGCAKKSGMQIQILKSRFS